MDPVGGGCRTNRTFCAVAVVAVLYTFRSTPVLLVVILLLRPENVRIPRLLGEVKVNNEIWEPCKSWPQLILDMGT